MENVSLLENLGERQLKTEVRNREILDHGCNTTASRDFFYYYYYFLKNYKKQQSNEDGHFIFPSPHANEFELLGKKTTGHSRDMQRHFGRGNADSQEHALNHASSYCSSCLPTSC